MATEVGRLIVELEARVGNLEAGMRRAGRSVETFGNRANTQFRGLQTRLRTLLSRAVGVGAALGAAFGAFSLVGFIRDSVEAASAVETFTIRLRALIGSGEIARQSLDNLREFARSVAPPLRDIIEAAATLGSVALGNAPRIERLTRTAANVAAITGLTLGQASQNLQRTLSAGIGAADLFRERGVRAVVEAISGIPNLIDVPLRQVEQAFDQVFGPDGVFGQAAEAFAATLPGTLSITGDALFELRRAFGDAISPAIILVLRDVVIPTFERFQRLIEENSDLIARRFLIVLQRLGGLLLRIGQGGALAGRVIFGFLDALQLNFALFQKIIADVVDEVVQLASRIPGVGRAFRGVAESTALFREVSQETFDRLLEGASETQETFGALADAFGESADALAGLDIQTSSTLANLREINEEAERQADALRGIFLGIAERLDPRNLREAAAALQRLTRAERATQARALRATDPDQQRLTVLQQQRDVIGEQLGIATRLFQNRVEGIDQDVAALQAARDTVETAKEREAIETALGVLAQTRRGDVEAIADAETRAANALRNIEREEQRILEDQARTRGRIAATAIALEATIRSIATIDTTRAAIIRDQLNARLAEADTLQEVLRVLEQLNREGQDFFNQAQDARFEESIGAVISDAASNALLDAVRGTAPDFGMILAETSANLLRDAIEETFDGLGRLLNEFVGQAQSRLGSAVSVALGVGAAILARTLRGTEVDVSSDQIRSAVTGTQQVRGVVAGPREIAVAQVGNAIRDGFVEPVQLLRAQNTILTNILTAIVASGGATAGDVQAAFDEAVDAVLATESVALT